MVSTLRMRTAILTTGASEETPSSLPSGVTVAFFFSRHYLSPFVPLAFL